MSSMARHSCFSSLGELEVSVVDFAYVTGLVRAPEKNHHERMGASKSGRKPAWAPFARLLAPQRVSGCLANSTTPSPCVDPPPKKKSWVPRLGHHLNIAPPPATTPTRRWECFAPESHCRCHPISASSEQVIASGCLFTVNEQSPGREPLFPGPEVLLQMPVRQTFQEGRFGRGRGGVPPQLSKD